MERIGNLPLVDFALSIKGLNVTDRHATLKSLSASAGYKMAISLVIQKEVKALEM